jgi:Zn-dependent protease
VNVYPHMTRPGARWIPWLAALVTTLLFFGSVLLHELSHSFMARRTGIGVTRITLFIFGGVAQVDEEPRKASDELLISIAGPAMSVLLAVVLGAGWWASQRFGFGPVVTSCLGRVAAANLVLAVFNMVPGFPLDGGRVLRSLLWLHWDNLLRATRVASIMGQVVGYSLIALGAWLGIASSSGLILVFYTGMGLLLAGAARATYQRERMRDALVNLTLWQISTPPELVVYAGTPVTVAASHFALKRPEGPVPILVGAQPIGVLSLDRLSTIPQALWTDLKVEQIMVPLSEAMVIRHNRRALEALQHMELTGQSWLMVIDDYGNLQGILTADGVRAALMRA